MTKYREPFFEDIDSQVDKFSVYCGHTPGNFQESELQKFRIIRFKEKKLFTFIHFKKVDWSAFHSSTVNVIHFADFRYTSLYILIVLRLFFKFKLYLHGQGGYKKNGYIQKFVYILFIYFSDGYICYNKFCSNSLKSKTPVFLHKKIKYIDNLLYILPVPMINKKYGTKITFIGRLRPNNGIENLLEAAKIVKEKFYDLELDIIGGGDYDYIRKLMDEYPFAKFHGVIYDNEMIQKLCENSMLGAYGGDAGLSVIHYMALGLPVIVHSDFYKHMGPEPSYVINNVNGLLFIRNDILDLSKKILMLFHDPVLRNKLAQGALDTYRKNTSDSMGKKIIDILNSGMEKNS
jgi:glycosyltransferase involved in cell wall biosynthesis